MLSTDMNHNSNYVKKKLSRFDNLSIIIKMTSVEFSLNTEGFIHIGDNIYLDNLPYLILFNKVPLSPYLEGSFKWTKKLVLNMLDKEINKLVILNSLRNSKDIGAKLKLLEESKRKIIGRGV